MVNNSISFVDFLKIDTEGYDVSVLSGATNALKVCPQEVPET